MAVEAGEGSGNYYNPAQILYDGEQTEESLRRRLGDLEEIIPHGLNAATAALMGVGYRWAPSATGDSVSEKS